MDTKRRIKAAEIIKAMKAGIPSAELMVKFGLTARQLDIVLQKMKDRGLLSRARPDRSNSNSDAGSAGSPRAVSNCEVLGPQEPLREQIEAALDRLLGFASVEKVKSNL